jgi:polygalacturonase
MRPVSSFLLLLLLAVLPARAQRETDRVFNVREFGATGDGIANDRAAIQRVVDSCSVGGGTVLFPAGKYLTGSIDLGSDVALHIQQGAVILGSPRLEDYVERRPALKSYNDLFLKYSLFYAEGKSNITIRGEGTIDGQGSAFPVTTKEKPARYMNRPFVLRFVECRNITVTGVTLRNSAMWMQHYLACDGLMIRGIRVWNHANQNNDMMDIDGCRNVVISDCIGDTEDDAITLKSTSPRVTENVTITNCVISSHCNAVKTGTESTGGFRNITISNIVVTPSANRVAKVGYPAGISGITLATVDGGILERISVSNCIIEGPQVPVFIRLGNRARKHSPDAASPGVGTLRDISISDITAVAGGPTGCSISGIPGHPASGIRLRNITITFPGGGTKIDAAREPDEAVDQYPEGTHWGSLPAYGFYLRHAIDLDLTSVTLRCSAPDLRPAIVASDVADLRITGLRAPGWDGMESLIRFANVREATVQGSTCLTPVDCFLSVSGGSGRIGLLSNDCSLARVPVRSDSTSVVRMEGNLLGGEAAYKSGPSVDPREKGQR